MTTYVLALQVIRRLLNERRRANENLHNVAKSMLEPGKKVQYQVNEREYFGSVVFIGGFPGKTYVRVMNLRTLKERNIELSQITGLIQEQ